MNMVMRHARVLLAVAWCLILIVGNVPVDTRAQTPPFPDSTELVREGGFETDTGEWGTNPLNIAERTQDDVYAGHYAVEITTGADIFIGLLRQSFVVPTDVVSATLRFAWKNQTTEPVSQLLTIMLTDNTIGETPTRYFDVILEESGGEWAYYEAGLTETSINQMRGQEVALSIVGATESGTDPAPIYLVDSVSLVVTTATPTPTPTATDTPTATNTPTPITPTATNTPTPITPTATNTPTPITPTATNTPTPITPTATNTPTPITPTATNTPTPITPTATNTPTPITPTPTDMSTAITPTLTSTVGTPTPTDTATPSPTDQPISSAPYVLHMPLTVK